MMDKLSISQPEIVIYNAPNNPEFKMEVRVENDSVWLNRHQIAELFDRDVKTIGKHIANALKEELSNFQVVEKFATTASDGKTYQVAHYNLDMVLSVGYRVKSDRGIHFRIWANQVLKDFLLKGFAIHQRFEKIEKKLEEHDQKFDLVIKHNLNLAEGIFFDGQIFDAWQFVSQLVKGANESVILIDNYKSHDRFLVIDRRDIYHIGASIKDLGRRWFAFSKINLDPKLILDALPR